MAKSSSETQSLQSTKNLNLPPPPLPTQSEVELVKCDSCGFTEECTPAYIHKVRDRYYGHWICGLCIEAVKDEVLRSDTLISTEEALYRHNSFCKKFKSTPPPSSETEHPISVMGRILRRSLDSPNRAYRSNSSSALPSIDEVKAVTTLVRSGSCFPALSS